MNRTLICLSGFWLVLLVVSVSLGQGPQPAAKGTSRDEAAIHDYILTMDEVNKYAAVAKKMQAAAGAELGIVELEIGNAAVRESRSEEDVVANAEIYGEARRYLPIVLDESGQGVRHQVFSVFVPEIAGGRPA